MNESFRCSNGAYLHYVAKNDETIDMMVMWIKKNMILVIGPAGEWLYNKFEDYDKYHTCVSNMMILGHSNLYFIEKTPELLKEQSELSEDILALIPSKNGMHPLRKKEELSLTECAREICAIILNYYNMLRIEDIQATLENISTISGLYVMDSEKFNEIMES